MKETIAFQGRIIEVVNFPVQIGEKTKIFEKARRAPGTRLIVDSGEKILLSKEFRHELQEHDMRLPGGKVFDKLESYNKALEEKQDLIHAATQAAKKECKEEVGIIAKNISLSTVSHCGATVEWDLYYFIVTDFEQSEQDLEEGEDITASWYSYQEVIDMCLQGKMKEGRSVAVLLPYLLNKK